MATEIKLINDIIADRIIQVGLCFDTFKGLACSFKQFANVDLGWSESGEIEEKLWYDYKRYKYPYIEPETELRSRLVLYEGMNRPTADEVLDHELYISQQGVDEVKFERSYLGQSIFEPDECLWNQNDDGMKLRSVITHYRDSEHDIFDEVKTGSWTGHQYI